MVDEMGASFHLVSVGMVGLLPTNFRLGVSRSFDFLSGQGLVGVAPVINLLVSVWVPSGKEVTGTVLQGRGANAGNLGMI